MVRRRKRPATPSKEDATLRLWAPWRYAYQVSNPSRQPSCIFCLKRLSAVTHRRRLILHETPLALVMLNRFPYNNGHLMIASRRHLASPELLTRAERTALDDLMVHAVAQLRRILRPSGLNLGANLGRVAGAGFADHMHWHLVPRWEGDNNFMPVISSTRVLGQHLEQSFDLLAPHFKAIETAIS
jgi:ATP adenylyltransferase